MYKRYTTIAGKTIITRLSDSNLIKTEKRRHPKTKPSSDAVRKVNAINQERELTSRLNANYRPGDWWMVLSNEAGTTVEDSMCKVARLKRGLKRYCDRKGIPYKLVESVGIGKRKGKVHHHLVLNQEIPLEIVYQYWPEQAVFATPLKGYNYQKIAKYMLKNAEESKTKRGAYKKAFRCSRQVVRPAQRVEEMKRQPTYDIEDLKPRSGYQIDIDSIRLYDNPITGSCCLEYIEVSLEPEPRVKHYYRGRPVRWDPMYSPGPEDQVSFDEIVGVES